MTRVIRDPVKPEAFQILNDYDDLFLDIPFHLASVNGIGPPGIEKRVSRAYDQDGSTIIDQVLSERVINISLDLFELWGEGAIPSIRGTRDALMHIISPGVGELKFRVYMNNGEYYEIRGATVDAFTGRGIDFAASPVHNSVALRLRCFDPAWYGAYRTVTIDANSNNDGVLPNWEYRQAVENFGSWWSGITATFTGPLYTPKMSLMTWNSGLADYDTVTYVELSSNVAAAANVIITTDQGNRGAVDGSGDNVSYTSSSFFKTFVLAFSPVRFLHDEQTDASWYNNFIGVDVVGGCTAASTLKLEWYDRYIGI